MSFQNPVRMGWLSHRRKESKDADKPKWQIDILEAETTRMPEKRLERA